jgi:hypothetical protein
MSLFVKLAAIVFAGSLVTAGAAEKSEDAKPKRTDSKESGEKKKDKKGKKKDKPPEDPNAPPKAIEVPMPNGHDAKVLNIPYRDSDGKLKMRFIIGVATKVDDTHVDMSDLQIETFDEEGNHEMKIDLPTSTLDLTTSVITAHKPVTIKREDFELHGDTMIFNTRTKQGGLGGNVRMLIYNLDNETSQTPAAESPATETPVTPTPATPEPNAK